MASVFSGFFFNKMCKVCVGLHRVSNIEGCLFVGLVFVLACFRIIVLFSLVIYLVHKKRTERKIRHILLFEEERKTVGKGE